MLGIAVNILSATGTPETYNNPGFQRQLTLENFEVCALTAAKGVCSGSIESMILEVSIYLPLLSQAKISLTRH